jgi:hypothetical protein
MTSYHKVKVANEHTCMNLNPYDRLFCKQYHVQNNEPYVQFDMVAEQAREYLSTDKQPCYFTSDSKGHLLVKERSTNTIHIFDKHFRETVVTHKYIHPYGDLVFHPHNIVFTQIISEEDYSKDGQSNDPYYMQILQKNTNKVFVSQSLNKPQYELSDMNLAFYDFAHTITLLNDNCVIYNESKLRELRLYLQSFLTPNEIVKLSN